MSTIPKQMTFGDWVRMRAARSGMTLAQVADVAGMSPSMLSKLMTGKRTLHRDTARRLAGALGVSVPTLRQYWRRAA